MPCTLISIATTHCLPPCFKTVTPVQPALGLVFVNTPPPVIPQFKRVTPRQPVQIMGPLPLGVKK